MNILFLSKRRPQNKDLITRPYGRFYYLPKVLATRGHNIYVLLLDYKKTKSISIYKDGIYWTSISIYPSLIINYLLCAKKTIKTHNIQWIVGFSDTYYGIIAQKLAKVFGIKCAIDSYDNYESYIPWLYPLHLIWRHSLKKADLVIVAGQSLADLQSSLGLRKEPVIVPMSADPKFIPADKYKSRKKLGLPINKTLVGYFGTLHRSRGTDILIKLIAQMSNCNDILFVLSSQSKNPIPNSTNTIWLGYLDDSSMPVLINSMDVALIINQQSKFGDYSYPVKLYEALNCKIPVVATDTKSVRWILSECPEMLIRTRDINSYRNKIFEMADEKNKCNIKSSWEVSCNALENALNQHS